MKNWLLTAGLALCVSALTGTALAAGQPPATNAVAGTNALGPKIQFAELAYDFGRAISGTLVKHDFVFTNTGDATLKISNVSPGCGCTTVGEWTHEVEPGKTGTISLQFNSSSYSQPVIKSTTVGCNDQSQQVVILQIRGTVFKAVELSQEWASFIIGPDSSGETNAVIHITNNDEEPITVSEPKSSLPCFAAEIKTNIPGKSFDLLIKTVPPFDAGQNQAVVSLQTSSKHTPTLGVIALVVAQSPLVVGPDKIEIPAGTLTSNVTVSVSVRNQSTQPVTLDHASVNAKGVSWNISSSQPGKMYTVTLNFPTGFEAPANTPLSLNIKTDHPWLRDLRVPIALLVAPPPTNSTAGR